MILKPRWTYKQSTLIEVSKTHRDEPKGNITEKPNSDSEV